MIRAQLLSTTALTASGLMIAAAASAQTAPASSPVQIMLGGYLYNFMTYRSDSDAKSQ